MCILHGRFFGHFQSSPLKIFFLKWVMEKWKKSLKKCEISGAVQNEVIFVIFFRYNI